MELRWRKWWCKRLTASQCGLVWRFGGTFQGWAPLLTGRERDRKQCYLFCVPWPGIFQYLSRLPHPCSYHQSSTDSQSTNDVNCESLSGGLVLSDEYSDLISGPGNVSIGLHQCGRSSGVVNKTFCLCRMAFPFRRSCFVWIATRQLWNETNVMVPEDRRVRCRQRAPQRCSQMTQHETGLCVGSEGEASCALPPSASQAPLNKQLSANKTKCSGADRTNCTRHSSSQPVTFRDSYRSAVSSKWWACQEWGKGFLRATSPQVAG